MRHSGGNRNQLLNDFRFSWNKAVWKKSLGFKKLNTEHLDTSHSFDYLWSTPMLKQEMGLFWCDHYLNNMKANIAIFLTKLIVFCNTCLRKRWCFLVFMGLKSYNFLCLAINHAGIARNIILLAHSYGKRKCWNQNFLQKADRNGVDETGFVKLWF